MINEVISKITKPMVSTNTIVKLYCECSGVPVTDEKINALACKLEIENGTRRHLLQAPCSILTNKIIELKIQCLIKYCTLESDDPVCLKCLEKGPIKNWDKQLCEDCNEAANDEMDKAMKRSQN